ncbi:MAG TPA: hypothetical protein VG188_11400 [Solirubrobacteraceae bacterium]|jgi:hypothetical protein|nr:hypothetical protein [Solirubrobacteraceae bacterium]
MASERQKAAARKNVKKAQSAAKGKQTLKHLSAATRSALGEEANQVRKGEAKTRKQLDAEARRLNIAGRSKMGKDELRQAIAQAR